MDALNMVVQVPAWAYDFCYYYLAVAAVVVVYSLYSLVQLLTLPSLVKKVVPVTAIAISLILSGAVTVLLTMMQFWVCRSALAPRMEKFAVTCKKPEDCTAVAGTQPAGSLCTCGQRGFCAGCVVNNDMEPSMMPEYDMPLAGIKEGFKPMGLSGVAPKRR
jgi:hypothetical protein